MKLSVIIPAYNAEKYIVECIKSIQSQSFNDYEIIVVNDGSTDNTLSICREISETDNRLIIINQENSGVSVARNNGIANACGEWITFVDADDMLQPGALDILASNKIINEDIIIGGYSRKLSSQTLSNDLVFTRVSAELLARGVLRFSKYKNKIKKLAPIDDYNNWACWGKFYKRDFLLCNNIRFPEGIRLSEDTYFCLISYLKANRIISVNVYLYFYRYNIQSVTKTSSTYLLENNCKLVKLFSALDLPELNLHRDFCAFEVAKLIDVFMCSDFCSTKLDGGNETLLNLIGNDKIFIDTIRDAPIVYLVNGKKRYVKYSFVLLKLKFLINQIKRNSKKI